jgi:hypothetical protein
MKQTVNVLVPVGQLGSGVRADEVANGIAWGAHAIAVDAGSTDSGAAYLAKGVSKNSREAVKRDLQILMEAQVRARIPLTVGSCGQAGGDAGVNWTRDIVVEVAQELKLHPRICLLYSEQDKRVLKNKNAQGKIQALPPPRPMTDALIDSCDHIVAAMGVEPYMAALDAGADIVLGGRTTDTAVIAALPLMRGGGAGATWHAAKVAECGALCTTDPARGAGVFLRIDEDSFIVEPLSAGIRCDTYSVSAHMLYENSDPFRLIEPGGILDVTAARYEQVSERSVRAVGARWERRPYTMKLEGAAGGPFQTIMLIGIQDPKVLAKLDLFHDRLLAALRGRVARTIGEDVDYDISLRLYGWNAVSGLPVPSGVVAPREVGVLFVATAPTQEMATRIAKTCNPYFFHFPLEAGTELPSYGFPFSPAEIERGRVYEFKLNHVVAADDPLELIRTEWIERRADGKV